MSLLVEQRRRQMMRKSKVEEDCVERGPGGRERSAGRGRQSVEFDERKEE